jgi:hypothetical protein
MKKYIRACPELGDGSSPSIYKLEELRELGEMIAELVSDGTYEVGETFTLEVIELSDEAFDALPEL